MKQTTLIAIALSLISISAWCEEPFPKEQIAAGADSTGAAV